MLLQPRCARHSYILTNKQELVAVNWLPYQPLPTFLTAGSDGLLSWCLQPEYLEQRALTMPGAEQACVALCTAAGGGGLVVHAAGAHQQSEADLQAASRASINEAKCTAFVADTAGAIWQVRVGEGRLAGCHRVAALPAGERVGALQWGQEAGVVAVGTHQGRVLRYTATIGPAGSSGSPSRNSAAAAAAVQKARGQMWQLEGQVLLDGPVTALHMEPHRLIEGVAATASCTAWFVDLEAQESAPVVCGHSGEVQLLVALLGACSGGSGSVDGESSSVLASVDTDGALRVWNLDRSQAVPAVELQSDTPCTAAAFDHHLPSCSPAAGGNPADGDIRLAAPSPSSAQLLHRLAAGYADGCVRLFDLQKQVALWSVFRHPSPLAALCWHPGQPLLLSASR